MAKKRARSRPLAFVFKYRFVTVPTSHLVEVNLDSTKATKIAGYYNYNNDCFSSKQLITINTIKNIETYENKFQEFHFGSELVLTSFR